jgi:hypothetical protein
MSDEHVLGLLRIDVHAARDDHVRLPVGQVQVAVLVEVPDVAERAPAPVVGDRRRLVGVVVVLERATAGGTSCRCPRCPRSTRG